MKKTENRTRIQKNKKNISPRKNQLKISKKIEEEKPQIKPGKRKKPGMNSKDLNQKLRKRKRILEEKNEKKLSNKFVPNLNYIDRQSNRSIRIRKNSQSMIPSKEPISYANISEIDKKKREFKYNSFIKDPKSMYIKANKNKKN